MKHRVCLELNKPTSSRLPKKFGIEFIVDTSIKGSTSKIVSALDPKNIIENLFSEASVSDYSDIKVCSSRHYDNMDAEKNTYHVKLRE